MEERIGIKTIFKSSNPEKLIVFHATSLKDEIRFYFNDEQYVVARDNNDGTLSVEYEEEQKVENDEQNNKSTLTYIKENIKDKEFLKFMAIAIGITSVIPILLIVLAFVIKNTLIYLLLINFMFFSIQVIAVVISEYKTTPLSLKSKHSAEHMMVNFIEKNKRLPKSMAEIKKTTRFCVDCGSRKKIRDSVIEFVQGILTAIISLIIVSFITQNCKNGVILGIIYLVVYYVTFYGIWNLMNKYNKLNFIINPIENMLNNIVQCANTTKNVEDNDIQLAYYAAKYWMQVVYPEFYTEEENNIFSECEKS